MMLSESLKLIKTNNYKQLNVDYIGIIDLDLYAIHIDSVLTQLYNSLEYDIDILCMYGIEGSTRYYHDTFSTVYYDKSGTEKWLFRANQIRKIFDTFFVCVRKPVIFFLFIFFFFFFSFCFCLLFCCSFLLFSNF